MSSNCESLAVIKHNLEYVIGQTHRSLELPPTEKICQAIADLSTSHRQYALILLLLDADRSGFFANLRQSALIQTKLLALSKKGGAHLSRFSRASNLLPFFCALAAGDEPLASSLTVASDTPFDEDYEFKEDHTYARFVHAYVSNHYTIQAEHEKLIGEFYQDVEESTTARYMICNAFFTYDSEKWQEGLIELLAEHEAIFEKKGERLVYDPTEFATDQFVMVEGLALLFLAKKAGLKSEDEYKFLPSIALV